MRARNPFNVIWLTAGIMLMAAYLFATAARGQPQPCALPLGEGQVVEGQELAGQLEVLSWNIQKASNAGWAKDLAGLSEGIDLAFIQEAAREAHIPQSIPLDLYPSFAAGYTTATQETGVLTLSAGTPSIHCEFQAWEPWLGTPKATSVTKYPLQDREDRLLAINLHAINFDLGLETFVSQFEAIREVLATHEGPIIVAGDLNTWSYGRQSLVDDFMLEHGLASVSFDPDLRTRAFGRALDHIYVRGLKANEARVVPVTSSDHNPLRVRLDIE
jgi:endonuclease/exonuclease/phosphatase (EEP) superfamily protein YafD